MLKLKEIKKIIVPVLKSSDVIKADVFGSFARGDFKKNSDLDLLVDFVGDKTFFDLVRLKLALEDVLGLKVDLLTYDGVNPRLRDRIFSEKKIIYEKRP